MKIKSLSTTTLAGVTALMQDACPGLTGEVFIAAIRAYEPEKPVIQKERTETLLTPKQAASRLQVSRGKIFQLLKTGRLKRLLLGKRTCRIPEAELRKLMESEVTV